MLMWQVFHPSYVDNKWMLSNAGMLEKVKTASSRTNRPVPHCPLCASYEALRDELATIKAVCSCECD